MALISVPSFSKILEKIANPEFLKCVDTSCILIGFRRSGLSVPYQMAASRYETISQFSGASTAFPSLNSLKISAITGETVLKISC